MTVPVPRVITEAEWLAEGERLFGPLRREWAFVCPACGNVQTGAEFTALGMTPRQAAGQVACACIGRWVASRGCAATLHGRAPIHILVVVHPDGSHSPLFEFAGVGAA